MKSPSYYPRWELMTTVQPSQRTQYICPLSPAISTLPAITHYTTSAGLRPPRTIAATGGLSPPDAPYQERPGGRNIQDYVICVSYCFFLLCHLCYSISAGLKTISREDAHLVYPRYPRVFLYMPMIYCPLPHPISVRAGWGYHCCVLVWLLAFC